MQYKKATQEVEETREYEQMIADAHKAQADLMYIAMMTDVDLDESEEEE